MLIAPATRAFEGAPAAHDAALPSRAVPVTDRRRWRPSAPRRRSESYNLVCKGAVRVCPQPRRARALGAGSRGLAALGTGLYVEGYALLRRTAKSPAALYISDKTASAHVSHILTKLGVANRGQAAAAAHRQNLLSQPPAS